MSTRTAVATLGASERTALSWCLAVFAGAFVLRAGLAIAWPTVHRADEIFQNLEPAYRLITGWGVVTWEWRDGIRSWLFPGFLVAILQAARLLHLPLVPTVAVVLAAVSSAGAGLGAWIGWRRAGWSGAILCGVLCVTWPDLVYFAPKPLLEVQAGNLVVLAAGLACLEREPSRSRLIAIGLLLGLAFDLRLQLAPACAAIAVFAGRRELRAWSTLLLAALAPVLLLGVLDGLTLGSPFQSIWKNIQVNLLDSRSEIYGVEPPGWYLFELLHRNGPASILIALCFGLGARLAPTLAVTAIVVVATHSLVAHKELSFVYAALPCVMIVAGLGAARLLSRLAKPTPGAIAAAVLACAVTAALASYVARPFREPGAQPPLRALWQRVRAEPDICGLGLFALDRFPWWRTPGYVGLQRSIPIYLLNGREALSVAAEGFNALIVDTADLPALPGGARVACEGAFCLIRRDQRCTAVPGFDVNAALQRLRQ